MSLPNTNPPTSISIISITNPSHKSIPSTNTTPPTSTNPKPSCQDTSLANLLHSPKLQTYQVNIPSFHPAKKTSENPSSSNPQMDSQTLPIFQHQYSGTTKIQFIEKYLTEDNKWVRVETELFLVYPLEKCQAILLEDRTMKDWWTKISSWECTIQDFLKKTKGSLLLISQLKSKIEKSLNSKDKSTF